MSANDDREIRLSQGEMKVLIRTTVLDTLTQLGVDHREPLEMQKDFQHLRNWRESTEAIQRKGMMTLVGIFVTSVAAAIFLGVKEYFSN